MKMRFDITNYLNLKSIRTRNVVLLVIVLLIWFVPRALLVNRDAFHYDTVDMLLQMRQGTLSDHGLWILLPSIFLICVSHIIKLFVPLATADLTSFLLGFTVFLSAITGVIMYRVISKLKGDAFAFIYTCLFCFAPNFFSVTTFGRIDHLFELIFLCLFLYYLFTKRLYAGALFLAMAVMSRVECLLFIPAALVYILWSDSKRRLRDSIIFLIISLGIWSALIVFVGWGRFFDRVILSQLRAMSESTIQKAPHILALFKFLFTCSTEEFKAVLRLAGLPFLCAAFGIVAMRKKRDFQRLAFFLTAFLVLYLFVSRSMGDMTRYLISSFFFAFFLSTEGILFIFKRRSLVISLTLACILSMFLPFLPMFYDRHKVAYARDYVRYVERQIGPNSILLVQDQGAFFKYYTRVQILQPPIGYNKERWNQFFVQMFDILKSGKTIYAVASAFNYDTHLYFLGMINDNFYVQIADGRPLEDWHDESLHRDLSPQKLFRLIPRPALQEALNKMKQG